MARGFGFSTGVSAPRVGRGLFRDSGRFGGVTMQWFPDWPKTATKELQPTGRQFSATVHDEMASAIGVMSRRKPGGGVHSTDDGWTVDIGVPRSTRTHWHLIEFGGGYHYGRAPVRRVLMSMGKFRALGRSSQ